MNNSKIKIQKFRVLFCILLLTLGFISVSAQSNSQNFPTPITSPEINGKIPARDIGDSRLTKHFYVFEGKQGDVFINVVTNNLDGDIDVFTADSLKPLTKIVVYADSSDNETGRVIYLRLPEKLILRIEGRTPNDDPATYRIKFAGSFVAMANVETEEQNLPEIKTENQGEVRVNSVGTIIEVKPKPTPAPKETIAETTPETKEKTPEIFEEKQDAPKKEEAISKSDVEPEKTEPEIIKEPEVTKDQAESPEKDTDQKDPTAPKVVITDLLKKEDVTGVAKTDKEKKEESDKAETENKAAEKGKNKTEEEVAEKEKSPKSAPKSRRADKKKQPAEEKTEEANPLENIRLIVVFKDGRKIQRPMSEILRVGVDKGILTIIHKDGSVGRYSILDVAKMTIE